MKKPKLLGILLVLTTVLHAQNRALTFDGTNDYVNCGNGFTAGNIRSMECWVKFNSLAGSQEIISKSIAGQGIELLLFNNALNAYCMFNGTNVSYISYPISNLTTGIWYHLAFTWNATKESMQLYINGKPGGTRTDIGNINTTGLANPGNLLIGDWSDPAPRPLNASVDEVRIWNTIRTPTEVKSGMYGTVPVNTAGLLAYYKLDEGTGTATVNNSTSTAAVATSAGTLVNGPAWLASSPVQGNENGLHLDGVSDYVVAPTNANYDFTTGTVECWIRTENLVGNACILGNRIDPTGCRYSFHISSSAIGLYNGTTYSAIPYTVTPGQWYHLAFVCTPTTTTIYVNGTSIGNTTNAISAASGLPLHIGVANPGSNFEFFSGSIDEVRIWNVARTQAQIQAGMNSSLTGTEANLVGLFGFNQGIAGGNNAGLITAIDGTSTSNNATLMNFGLTGNASNWVSHQTSISNPAPVVASFSPASGAVGTSVVISGNNFNTTPANNVVYFGDTRAVVIAASTTSLTVTVPAGASYQPVSVLNSAYGLTGYSPKPFQVTFTGNTYTLNPKNDLTTGGNPMAIASGDLNNDGKTDVVLSSYADNIISIYTNAGTPGTISLSVKQDIATGTGPYSIAIGDIDGDGRKDIAVANTNVNSFSVFRNTTTGGTITFAARVNFTTNLAPRSIAIADLDGDGKPEVVVASTTSNTLDLFRNLSTVGDFSFEIKKSIAITNIPQSLATIDIDGDGKVELITANNNGASVFQNTSTIGILSFGSPIYYATGSSAIQVSTGDIDSDGKQDLVIVNKDASSVSVLRNISSTGVISFSTQQSFATGTTPYWAAITDMNGDGKSDISIVNAGDNTVSVLANRSTAGNLSFDPKTDFATGAFPVAVIASDLDGDSRPDLAMINNTSSTMSTLRNLAQATLPVTGLSFAAAKSATGVHLSWSTQYEVGSQAFDVEKSADGRNFAVIGSVAAAGASVRQTAYGFDDRQPASGVNYYRLTQTDKNGRSAHSAILIVNWQIAAGITLTLAPQPVRNLLTVTITGHIPTSTFTLFNVLGKAVRTCPVTEGCSSFQLDRSGLPGGVYFYNLKNNLGQLIGSGRIIAE